MIVTAAYHEKRQCCVVQSYEEACKNDSCNKILAVACKHTEEEKENKEEIQECQITEDFHHQDKSILNETAQAEEAVSEEESVAMKSEDNKDSVQSEDFSFLDNNSLPLHDVFQ